MLLLAFFYLSLIILYQNISIVNGQTTDLPKNSSNNYPQDAITTSSLAINNLSNRNSQNISLVNEKITVIVYNASNYFNQTVQFTLYNYPSNIASFHYGNANMFAGFQFEKFGFLRYVNSYEQFIILSSQEVIQDSELISIEASYYTTEAVNIIFMAFKECGSSVSDFKVDCNVYLNRTDRVNLTIIDQMNPILLNTSLRNNYFSRSMISNSSSFAIKKGYVPVVRKIIKIGELRINSRKEPTPDYTCLFTQNGNQLFNISMINFTNIGYYNAMYKFSYKRSDITLTNRTIIVKFETFGLHWLKCFSNYNGNLFSLDNYFVKIDQTSSFPFQNIKLNSFELNCNFDETLLYLECFLKINISNYGFSNQQLTIDYGNSTYETIELNPYWIPFYTPSEYLASTFYAHSGLLLLNNFVKQNGKIDSIEIYSFKAGSFRFKLYSFYSTDCNSIETCSKFIENKKGSSINLRDESLNILSERISVKKGYNLIGKNIVENYAMYKNMVPTLLYGTQNMFISIDTSNGTKYSDYNFNSFDSYKSQVNLNRINSNLNWRYYVRFRYTYEQNENNFKFNRRYPQNPMSKNDGFNVTVWLNLTDETKYKAIQSIKSKLTTMSPSIFQITSTWSDNSINNSSKIASSNENPQLATTTSWTTKQTFDENDQNTNSNQIIEEMTNKLEPNHNYPQNATTPSSATNQTFNENDQNSNSNQIIEETTNKLELHHNYPQDATPFSNPINEESSNNLSDNYFHEIPYIPLTEDEKFDENYQNNNSNQVIEETTNKLEPNHNYPQNATPPSSATNQTFNENDQNTNSNQIIEEFFNNFEPNSTFDLSALMLSDQNSANSSSFLTNILIQSKYDINNCISNCSNKGLCKLNDKTNQLKCQCELDFSGSSCQIDRRPCSGGPCLHYLTCKNVLNSTEFDQSSQSYKNVYSDFECLCKKGYFGKRCESKINLCENETCSGNGLCKVVNETIVKCECFGINAFEGEKCEKKSNSFIARETSIKTTYIIAIIIIILFFCFFILMDLHSCLTRKNKPLKRKPQIKIKPTRLHYVS